MRVLIIHPGIYVYGGAELIIVKLANYLRKKGIENSLLTTFIVPEMREDLIETDIIIQKKLRMVPFSALSEIIALHKGLRSNFDNFDLINVHNFPAELSIFPYHKPVVWMCNELPEVSLRLEHEPSLLRRIVIRNVVAFDKFAVRRYIKKVVVADEFNAERFQKLYGIKPEIINYGIDYDFFSKGKREGALQEFNLSGNFIVLQVGLLTPLKNQMESVKTIEKLKDKIPNIKLVLAGWGESAYIRTLKEYIREKNLGSNVTITGHLPRESIRDLYQASDVLLHPIEPQGGWLAPFEALCAQKPIVVSSRMSASNIIEREKIGVVTEDFVGVILDIYDNPDKYRQIAIRGQRWVKENLNWDRFCEEMLNLFIEVSRPR